MEEDISFEDLGLDEQTLAAVAVKGFETPSPIQILAIPRLLNGDANIIAKARTGTGKTAAFGLPLVQKIRTDTGYPQALILTPTRELALQVCREIESFTTKSFPRLTAVYGGAPMGAQLRDLKRGVEIVVGTPGRVKDHIERGSLKLDKISYFILDEADEMLDMGFIEDIENIFGEANPDSRILLFSATMPPPILKIASTFMGDYEIVEEEARPEEPLLTEQRYWVVREYEKVEALVRLIDLSPDFYGLVFTQTKSDADMVSKQLDERGYEVAALHGDIPQNQREKILSRFRNKKTRILVATDVAARGIDIEGLTHVVNYQLPYDGPTYVHRIGRTGRAGAKGLAYTLVRPDERRKLEYLKQTAKKATKGELKEEVIPSVDEVLAVKKLRVFEDLKTKLGFVVEKAEPVIAESSEDITPNTLENTNTINTSEVTGNSTTGNSLIGQSSTELNSIDSVVTPTTPIKTLPRLRKDFVQLASDLCKDTEPEEVLARVLQLHCGNELDSSRYGSITQIKNAGGSNQVRLYVQLGRKDGFNAREVASYFSELLHIPQRLIDRIEVTESFSLLSLPPNSAKEILERSLRDRTMPHMHIDTKENSGFSSGRGSRGRGGFSRGGSSFDGGYSSKRRSDGEGRRSDGEGRRSNRRFDDKRKSFDTVSNQENRKSFSRSRKGAVPGISRIAEEKTSNASLYKKGIGRRG